MVPREVEVLEADCQERLRNQMMQKGAAGIKLVAPSYKTVFILFVVFLNLVNSVITHQAHDAYKNSRSYTHHDINLVLDYS